VHSLLHNITNFISGLTYFVSSSGLTLQEMDESRERRKKRKMRYGGELVLQFAVGESAVARFICFSSERDLTLREQRISS